MSRCYFAYGSNMNPARVTERGLLFESVAAARLDHYRLVFNKGANRNPGAAHANIEFARGACVEGVVYVLASTAEILKMDPFENAPRTYGRDVVAVVTEQGPAWAWTYFANPAVLREGLAPPRAYLDHLLAGAPYLSQAYLARLRGVAVLEE